jgi:glycosyltransferase involved in cell wall biosynthesis
MKPLVSVVIPTYNRENFVAEAVASVLAQSYVDFELIVVDDGSDDATVALLAERFDDTRLMVVSQPNLGVSAARNTGAKLARGEWFAFLDSDDTWLENKLEVQLTETLARPDTPVSYTEEIWYRRGVRVNPKKRPRKAHRLDIRQLSAALYHQPLVGDDTARRVSSGRWF